MRGDARRVLRVMYQRESRLISRSSVQQIADEADMPVGEVTLALVGLLERRMVSFVDREALMLTLPKGWRLTLSGARIAAALASEPTCIFCDHPKAAHEHILRRHGSHCSACECVAYCSGSWWSMLSGSALAYVTRRP